MTEDKILRESIKVDALMKLFNHESIDDLLNELTPFQLFEMKNFIWDKLSDFHIKLKGSHIRMEQIMSKVTPISTWQRQEGCYEPPDYCETLLCVNSSPNCAGKRIKEITKVMIDELNKCLEA
jgi:hypothetical protein